MIMRYLITGLLSAYVSFTVSAQQTSNDSLPARPDTISSSWSFEIEAYYYILPGEKNTTTLIGDADHKAFHLESRYNYEDVKTASVFGGYNFKTGNKLQWALTPMVGFIFGNTYGFAPGFEGSLRWKKFDFYSESEYVVNFAEEKDNFFYTWTELAITPIRNFRMGMSVNKTRLIHSDLEIQRGIFTEYSFWKLTAAIHYFNPFSDEEYLIATLHIEF